MTNQQPSRALATLGEKHRYVSAELEKARDRLTAIIPVATGLTPSRAIAVVLDALVRDPNLLNCDPRSIVRSVIHAAEIGLELGSPLGEAYLVPFKGKATMMVGYRGFVKLIRGAPHVVGVKGILVREADEFDVDEGNQRIHHKIARAPNVKERGEVIYAYSRIWTDSVSPTGERFAPFEVMDRGELDKLKADGLAKDSRSTAPWRKHTEEMYKKCPLRRQAKWQDLSPLGRKAVESDDLNAMARGEFGGVRIREGFNADRADELKDMLKSAGEKVEPLEIEAEILND